MQLKARLAAMLILMVACDVCCSVEALIAASGSRSARILAAGLV